ncbi:SecDF P1 head subdomain-containing protein [Rhodoglobus aureus]|uniref:SecDF P1 head subdomain domain-containing protein n=1 Tax=Rhodoglobus aureus TaxID=191497 RepID=A0ABP4G6F4_9MICO
MSSEKRRFSLLLVAVLALSGCAAAADADADEPTTTSGGTLELAVSETCVEGSDPECILVNDGYILRPSVFERATVETAEVSESQSGVDVTFTDEGAAVLHTLTENAAEAGSDARLVIAIGGEIHSTTFVAEPLTGNQVLIALPPEEDAQETADLINGN